jgi:hypothetical protein
MKKGCCKVEKPPVVPQRSTFCFSHSTRAYLSNSDIITLTRQWDTFERVENINSIVYSTIVGTKTFNNNQPFYTFLNNNELKDYEQGRLNHIAEYPSVTDFVVPYSKKPVAVSSIIGNAQIFGICCPDEDKSKRLSNNERVTNIKALNLYVRVSTQTALYPKSPYKFIDSQEYLLYKNYKERNC